MYIFISQNLKLFWVLGTIWSSKCRLSTLGNNLWMEISSQILLGEDKNLPFHCYLSLTVKKNYLFLQLYWSMHNQYTKKLHIFNVYNLISLDIHFWYPHSHGNIYTHHLQVSLSPLAFLGKGRKNTTWDLLF